MEFTGMGGGIMVALAAGLWLVYLMPSWFKRREYVASERTEVRRQQAMRVLQETAPLPATRRIESIVSPTGQVTDRDKLAEAIRRSRDAQAARVAGRALVEQASPPVRDAKARARVARRLRRTRALASLLLVAAIVVVIVQVSLMITTGVAMAAWAVLGFSTVVGVVAVSALGRLASIARRRSSVPVVRAARTVTRSAVVDEQQPELVVGPVASWTPVPVPKPMYLTRAVTAPVEAGADAMEQLRAAARASDRALRAAQESPEVTPITIPAPQAAPSRYARMGIVDQLDVAGTDLDEVLRRRRVAG
jgi:hypothetical protein